MSNQEKGVAKLNNKMMKWVITEEIQFNNFNLIETSKASWKIWIIGN